LVDFRFGSKADIGLAPVDVRFTPKSGHGGAARSRIRSTLILRNISVPGIASSVGR
jgi:hypothetical protein